MRWSMRLGVVLLSLFCCLGLSHLAHAHPKANGPFGLGVILYEPTGVTGKYFFTNTEALDFHIGLDGLGRYHHENIGFYVDYLFHFDVGVNTTYFSMPLYLGPGGTLILADRDRYCTKFRCYDEDTNVYLAVRMPFGLAFWFTKFGGEAFIELSLQLFVIPRIDLDLDAALGFRYYF